MVGGSMTNDSINNVWNVGMLGPYMFETDMHAQSACSNAAAAGMQNAAGLAALMRGIQAYKPPSKIDRARERFGQPFAHEPGATWVPRKVPVLTEWMQRRGHDGRNDVLADNRTRGIR